MRACVFKRKALRGCRSSRPRPTCNHVKGQRFCDFPVISPDQGGGALRNSGSGALAKPYWLLQRLGGAGAKSADSRAVTDTSHDKTLKEQPSLRTTYMVPPQDPLHENCPHGKFALSAAAPINLKERSWIHAVPRYQLHDNFFILANMEKRGEFEVLAKPRPR